MTDTAMPEQTDAEDWGDVEQSADTYPEHPANPHNHVFTLSYAPDKAPFMVVRANTSAELKMALDELESSGVYTDIGNAYAAFKAQATLGRGVGPASPVPAAPAAPNPYQAAAQQQYNQQPAQQYPNQPYAGQPAWQQAGAPAQQLVPPGWYKLNVPFPQKGIFDGIVAQNGFVKGDPTRGGQVSFQKATKSWYCAPDIAGAFAQFTPVPA